jgi:fatty acid desaturase 2 (delta-6 desaturase)
MRYVLKVGGGGGIFLALISFFRSFTHIFLVSHIPFSSSFSSFDISLQGGHYSLTGNILIDRTLQIVLYGVGCGMSGSWWRSQHNKHHSMPQKLGHDVDLNTLPLVAFTEKIVKRAGLPQKVWVRLQAFLFPVVITLLVALGWQFYLHPRHIVRQKNIPEAVSLAARFGVFFAFIVPKFGLSNAWYLYLAYNWIAANYIFINFAVSHTHLPTVPKEDTQVDWVRYAAIHTMNVEPGPFNFVDWWMSYLNYQIEHHLFPSMPQFRHPQISPRVRALLEKHGLKYDQRNYIDAMRVTFTNLHNVGVDVFYG